MLISRYFWMDTSGSGSGSRFRSGSRSWSMCGSRF